MAVARKFNIQVGSTKRPRRAAREGAGVRRRHAVLDRATLDDKARRLLSRGDDLELSLPREL
jgi:hypothetical protein